MLWITALSNASSNQKENLKKESENIQNYMFIHIQCIFMIGVLNKSVLFVWLVVFNATFNNISAISWRSVLLVEETGVPWEKHRPAVSHWQIYHIMLYTSPWSRFELTTSVLIGTDCIGSCRSNYHTITATTVPTSANQKPWFKALIPIKHRLQNFF